MDRKIRRKKRRCDYNPLGDDLAREFPDLVKKTEPYEGRCAYCGRLLHPGGWHWMRDEFGQLVRKCNDEYYCIRKCSRLAYRALERARRK